MSALVMVRPVGSCANGCVAKTGEGLVEVAFVFANRYLNYELQASLQMASLCS